MERDARESEIGWYLNPNSFGRAGCVGKAPNFLHVSIEKRFIISAWEHACPSRLEVANTYGLEWATNRYEQCNEFTKEIWRRSQSKPFLHWALTTPILREPTEPVGKYEPGAVPDSHNYAIAPLSGICGYALPRVGIEIAGRGDDYSEKKYDLSLDLLDKEISSSSDPVELLAYYSEAALETGVDPIVLLGHVFASGILVEENCQIAYREVMREFIVKAPKLWEYYESLSVEEREKNGIATLL